MTTQEFITKISKYIIKYAPKYDIKVHSPIIAQAILESAKGTSELAVNANNFFGLKYNPNRCPTSNGIYYKTGSEQNPDGSYVSSAMKWCKFNNMEDGVIGYFDFINVPRYASLKGVTDPKTYLENIKAAGYATSLKYVDNLMNVIKSYDLTKYDIKEEEIKKYYRCQCGCFNIEANATELMYLLKSNGFEAIVKEKDGKFYVQSGAYINRENAENKVKDLKDKGFDCFIKYE